MEGKLILRSQFLCSALIGAPHYRLEHPVIFLMWFTFYSQVFILPSASGPGKGSPLELLNLSISPPRLSRITVRNPASFRKLSDSAETLIARYSSWRPEDRRRLEHSVPLGGTFPVITRRARAAPVPGLPEMSSAPQIRSFRITPRRCPPPGLGGELSFLRCGHGPPPPSCAAGSEPRGRCTLLVRLLRGTLH